MDILYFATHNKHKLSEAQEIANQNFDIRSILDLSCTEEIPETANTLSGNALQKARYVHNKYHCNCFSDDTGLEIDALNGRPGVFSARYAGENCSFQDNIDKVLREMQGLQSRSARFKTVIALILDNNEYLFEGVVEGEITIEQRGRTGFGYDPIFLPTGCNKTFAEMSAIEKNEISHRGRAMAELMGFLNQQ